MAQANRYLNDSNLTLKSVKIELNDFYHQQDQESFEYIPTPHPLIQDMNTLMYTQQSGTSDKTGIVTTTSGATFLDPNEQAVYTTTNSDMMGLCTTYAQNTLPMVTGSSSSNTLGTDTVAMIMKTSNSATTASASSPPSSTWTPSASPLSTSSTSLTCMSAPLLLPASSSTDSSFLSPLSSSFCMGINGDAINYTSNETINTQHQPLETHHSPMPTTFNHEHQQHSIPVNTLSPTFMPLSHRSSLTLVASPRTTASPTMTTSASAPTAMISDIGIPTSPSGPHHSMDFKIPCQPIHENKNDQDTSPINHRRSQSNLSATTNTELRRQIHIQSEQKRRAQIKDGFEDLRNELPSCLNKKMSKVALLQRTVQHIQHLKSTQITILGELERLMNENEHLLKFQENAIQQPESMKSYHNLNSM